MGATGSAPLRIGMIGSGFMARFHLEAMAGVRDAVIGGVFSPVEQRREDFAARSTRPASARAGALRRPGSSQDLTTSMRSGWSARTTSALPTCAP